MSINHHAMNQIADLYAQLGMPDDYIGEVMERLGEQWAELGSSAYFGGARSDQATMEANEWLSSIVRELREELEQREQQA